MRRLYNDARLIHADLSEYNILYMKGTCYVIDVGQAVVTSHPKAMIYLERDAVNITNFFKKIPRKVI